MDALIVIWRDQTFGKTSSLYSVFLHHSWIQLTLDATNGGVTSPGAVTLTAAGVLKLNDNLTASGPIAIKSNGLTIGGTALSSGTASTTILTSVAGTTIASGATLTSATSIDLSATTGGMRWWIW